jgi:hypothetical protein
MKNLKTLTTLGTASALALSFALLPNANAKPGDNTTVTLQPTFGTAMIDGNASEWDTTADFAATMCTAGSVAHDTMTCDGPGKVNLSDLYLRYDCGADVLYVLVLEEDGYQAERSASDAWVTIGGNSNKVVNGSSPKDGALPNFAWVESGGELVGYEAAFELTPGTHDDVEVHLNVSANTSSTGKKNTGGKISIQVPADCQMPPVNEGEPPVDSNTAEPPLLATGVDLDATLNDNGEVVLTLETASETNTAAWLILRGDKLDNGGMKIDVVCEFLTGTFMSTNSSYPACIDKVEADVYRAAEIEYNGSLILYDEVMAK